ncbi:trans-sulfuration enzyme family protein [Evansella cellulosilytica]|uniref:homocysteine desulfhydrase n=1 Tax=Evansella cellulosilytica (strain ATCC 21833 / DSM 2522 / FERM P-1141 / JCM 9156 / N-4) TaxID=649639 RepID=E6TVT2_EVAC2|nr:PLP-dependent aspartate aminotransferase family protein [Evansella cellulosilytica]ADU28641.1 Cys/Met metabolism pyridoxal-phosphate-dependent protein [Evansella cellulosilytica DSM 2522]
MRFETKNVHFQEKLDHTEMSKTKPIYQTSAFSFHDLDDMESFFKGEKSYLYTRVGNPNTDDLGKGVADLEGADKGAAASSGISAILAAVLAVAKSGDHIIATEDLYGGTYQLMAKELIDFGIETSFVDFTNKDSVINAIKDNTVLLYSESITNPLLRVENIEQVVGIAKEYKLKTIIDNTFATPYLIRPHESGVDLVVHSATKYIGGHSDLSAGVVTGSNALMSKVKAKITNIGSNLGPFDGWLACRGLKTLSLRMERQSRNASTLANYLASNENIKKVYYPTAASKKGNGAIVSIELAEHVDVHQFFRQLSWVKVVPTLAGVETSVTYPLGTSHRSVPEATRERLGVSTNLVRISVGIEDEEDIVEAFTEALSFS